VNKSLKIGIFFLVLLCLVLISFVLFYGPQNQPANEESVLADAATSEIIEDKELVLAVKEALASADGRWAEFTYQIDHVKIQDDGQKAIVWLAPVDPETGAFIGREPELALARRDKAGQWQVLLEDDEEFLEIFKAFQYTEKNRQGDIISEDQAMPKSGQIFGGYYLPWAAGLEKRLTWSVAHTSCYPIYYCTHAFDFADGTMFPLVAAKGGTVFHWKDTCANGDSYCTNSITLQDRSTTPWTYQIYLHIAQGSIPGSLKKVGIPVMQGQYLANVDDTGYSSGHHVHFMVVSEETRYMSSGMGSVWGVAEDITYRDVDINWDPVTKGGRPRLAYEAADYGGEGRTYYVSGNQPANPPVGGLTSPVTKTLLTTRILTVTGWGLDDVAVTKYEILANTGGDWFPIGNATEGINFATTVDLCEADLPDGPFEIAVRVWDYEGNPSAISSVRKVIKDVECGTNGTDPRVTLSLDGGLLALPQSGLVQANTVEGSGGYDVQSVAFWLHGLDWEKADWVLLGMDTNGLNGWQAPIITTELPEASTYTLVAVAIDSAGNQDADVNFNAIVDHTDPWVFLQPISSPYYGSWVTFKWTGGDDLTGLDHFAVGMKVNSGGYHELAGYLPTTVSSYQVPIAEDQLLLFEVIAYDNSGNFSKSVIPVYANKYIFPYQYIAPIFLQNE